MLVASASRHVPFTTTHYPHLTSIAPFRPATSPVQKGQAPGRGWGDLLNPKRHLGSHQPICFLLDRLDQHLKSMADLAAQHPTLHFWPMRPKPTFNLRYGLARTRNEKITLLSFQKWRQHEMRCNLDEPATIHPWLHEYNVNCKMKHTGRDNNPYISLHDQNDQLLLTPYPLCEVLQLPPRNLLKPKALRLIRHEQGIIASQAELRTMGFSFLRPQKKTKETVQEWDEVSEAAPLATDHHSFQRHMRCASRNSLDSTQAQLCGRPHIHSAPVGSPNLRR